MFSTTDNKKPYLFSQRQTAGILSMSRPKIDLHPRKQKSTPQCFFKTYNLPDITYLFYFF